ncbi:sensor histidine kinase [Caulobacter vibrioides]|nr:HAMP domain-containing sensor histidine kinase [Caulobacter vibrioides]YP_002516725.2 two component sensor histidine kinase [Caulobacter vibrioides NA1000]ACL94817.2 two component sensor histidine kinase [Caulobacter vibrioides NA1000]ATC24225.1 sensor histidine kinase [Caulobacter vibrioides]ATC28108.1 sensor histidine kinase [Caulobacter vibrioides]AZH14785.1 sensor histidine kinase [Caulobacter vibrioides]PLR08233.1 sensor histidine kinase [Caulobacter vibrioides]
METRVKPLFSTRLTVAFALMASLALAQGGLAAWIADRAEHQVLRGRVAGDLQSAFWELSATKQRLRAWSLRALIGAPHAQGDGEMLRLRMADAIVRLQDLSARAEQMDRAMGIESREGPERDDALKLLSQSVVSLREPIAEINRSGPAQDVPTAWAAIETVFDKGAGRDLREMLNERIRDEAEILKRTRETADLYLERVKLLSWSAAGTLSLMAIILAVYFIRALRRPLAAMSDGAKAFEQGYLDHRMPEGGFREFSHLGASMNHMAAELSARREQEAELRASLEVQVATRTEELEAALAELRQVEARRRQLLGDISHELRTPMTAIRGEAEVTLRGRKSLDDYREALQRITLASGQMGALIEDLLMMARSDAELLHLNLTDMDPRQALEEAIATLSPIAHVREVELRIGIDDGAVRVAADGQRLQQVMALMLDNAIRYSHPGGTVEIVAGVPDDAPGSWRLEIKDQGIGINEADLVRVFERGFRSAAARAHRADGTGLGLPIAKALTERQGGSLTLHSQTGHGVSAILTLPCTTNACLEGAH